MCLWMDHQVYVFPKYNKCSCRFSLRSFGYKYAPSGGQLILRPFIKSDQNFVIGMDKAEGGAGAIGGSRGMKGTRTVDIKSR